MDHWEKSIKLAKKKVTGVEGKEREGKGKGGKWEKVKGVGGIRREWREQERN